MFFSVVTVAASAAFCYLGSERLPALSNHLFVRLPSLCLEVCLSFVICLNISLPLIQLLSFEQGTSVFHLKFPFKSVSMRKPGRTRQEVIQLKSPISLNLGFELYHPLPGTLMDTLLSFEMY